jgi:hypothetical protein
VRAIPCNPGLAGSFPWLAKLARRYEQYRFKRLKYEFRSVAASSTSGVVMMSFDYDPADAAPATKSEQAQTVPNTETNVWMNNDLSIPMDSEWKYVRAGTLGANLDKTYDMGNLWLSTSYGNNVTGGELYVEYSVEFRRPTDGPEVCGTYTSASPSTTTPLGVNEPAISGSAFPFRKLNTNTFGVVSGGEYSIVYRGSGSGITSSVYTPNIISGGSTSVSSVVAGVSSASTFLCICRIRVETGDEFQFPPISATSISSVKFWVASIDYDSYA